MKSNIHPSYGPVTFTCSCGNAFTTGSALGKDLFLEVCDKCHPFCSGKPKQIDTAGRLDKFSKKFGSFSLKKNTTQG